MKIPIKKLGSYISVAALTLFAVVAFCSCSAPKACDTHTVGEWSVSKEPTCLEDGVSVRRCVDCDEIVEFRNDRAKGHEAGEWEIETEATCTSGGSEIQKCRYCQTVVAEKALPPAGHVPGEFEMIVEPTCTQQGKQARKCTVCSEVLEIGDVAALDHVAETWTQIKAPSCLEIGETARICQLCNQTVETRSVEPSGHNAGSWVVVKEASCTEEGTQQRKCVVCTAVVETRTVEAKGHTKGSWITVNKATCVQSGSRHKKCTVCSQIVETEAIAPLGHAPGEWEIIKAATCTEAGQKRSVCTVCSDVSAIEDIPRLEHIYENDLCRLCGERRVAQTPKNEVPGDPIWYLKSETSEEIANGVTHTKSTYVDGADKQYQVNVLTVDPAKAGFMMGSSGDGYDYALDVGKRQNTKQHMEAAASNGVKVIAGVNADFFFINSDYHPEGLAIKNGTLISVGDGSRPYFAITKDNKAIIGKSGASADTNSIFTAVGGSHVIVEDGKVADVDMGDSFGYTAHPRTVVGIKKDNTVILAVIDGRQPSVSNGASLEKCAELMISLGAQTAINLDGGGSSTMIVVDGDEYTVKNSPSDGKLRNIYNSLLVVEKQA